MGDENRGILKIHSIYSSVEYLQKIQKRLEGRKIEFGKQVRLAWNDETVKITLLSLVGQLWRISPVRWFIKPRNFTRSCLSGFGKKSAYKPFSWYLWVLVTQQAAKRPLKLVVVDSTWRSLQHPFQALWPMRAQYYLLGGWCRLCSLIHYPTPSVFKEI